MRSSRAGPSERIGLDSSRVRAWTVLLMLGTVGVDRWSRILAGRVPIRELRADHVEGDDFNKRSMRARAK